APPRSAQFLSHATFVLASLALWSAPKRPPIAGVAETGRPAPPFAFRPSNGVHLVPRYYLGVDGGGTNCRIRLANENLETLAEARNGRSNLQIDGGEPAYRAILDGTRDVFAAAGIDYARAADTHACFGMAGGRMDTARDAFAARQWPFAGVKVFDDIDIAHAGALAGGEGGVIIVGTGSAAMSIVAGKRHQAGGWGFHIGDQMSGAIVGRELVRYAVEAEDGLVESSPLTQAGLNRALATAMDLSRPSRDGGAGDAALIGRAPAEYGKLMPLFIQHFEQGDPVAIKMMDIELGYIDTYVRWFKAHDAQVLAV